jgi:hypothetical protein
MNRNQCKVEFRTEKYFDNKRRVYYRIVPSELPFWKRWFHNDWEPLYHRYEYIDSIKEHYDPKEYAQEVLPLTTYGDVRRYLEETDKIVRKQRIEKLKNGDIWPDELDKV